MKKARILYGMLFLFTLVMMIYSQYYFFLVLLILEGLFPILLYLLLKYDLTHISVDYFGDHNGHVNDVLNLYLKITSKTLLVIGSVEFSIVSHNIVFEEDHVFQYHQNLDHKETKIPCTFETPLCGDIIMTCKDIYFYDLFGICKIHLPFQKMKNITVVPEQMKMDMFRKKDLSFFKEGNHDYLLQKGIDMSDIYDLRNYHDGDDIRHIHWKLSAKMQQTLLKEGSHNSSINTVMLVDIGLNQENEKLNSLKLSKAVSYAISFSESLIQQGVSHYLVLCHKEKMNWIPILDLDDVLRAQPLWLSLPLQHQNGASLPIFLSEKYELPFSKMIYFTVRDFSSDVNLVGQGIDFTAITIKENIQDVKSLKKETSQFIELPFKNISQNVYHFDI